MSAGSLWSRLTGRARAAASRRPWPAGDPAHGQEVDVLWGPLPPGRPPPDGSVVRRAWGWAVVLASRPVPGSAGQQHVVMLRRLPADREAVLDVLRS